MKRNALVNVYEKNEIAFMLDLTLSVWKLKRLHYDRVTYHKLLCTLVSNVSPIYQYRRWLSRHVGATINVSRTLPHWQKSDKKENSKRFGNLQNVRYDVKCNPEVS